MQGEGQGASTARGFEEVVLPHLDAAYNLARWLVRNPHDAEDVVQEACLRAMRFFGGYQERNAKAWLLQIVRNTAYSFFEKTRARELADEFDETLHLDESKQSDAEEVLVRSVESQMLQVVLEELPLRSREALILRELEGLSYKEIAEVMDVPIGTVMSSLARARSHLREIVLRNREKEVQRGLRR